MSVYSTVSGGNTNFSMAGIDFRVNSFTLRNETQAETFYNPLTITAARNPGRNSLKLSMNLMKSLRDIEDFDEKQRANFIFMMQPAQSIPEAWLGKSDGRVWKFVNFCITSITSMIDSAMRLWKADVQAQFNSYETVEKSTEEKLFGLGWQFTQKDMEERYGRKPPEPVKEKPKPFVPKPAPSGIIKFAMSLINKQPSLGTPVVMGFDGGVRPYENGLDDPSSIIGIVVDVSNQDRTLTVQTTGTMQTSGMGQYFPPQLQTAPEYFPPSQTPKAEVRKEQKPKKMTFSETVNVKRKIIIED